MRDRPKKDWSPDWEEDCLRWHGRVLTGKRGHWCSDWDYLPIDETSPEFAVCTCLLAREMARSSIVGGPIAALLADRDALAERVDALRRALTVIAEWPVTDDSNMDAVNMAICARDALAIPSAPSTTLTGD